LVRCVTRSHSRCSLGNSAAYRKLACSSHRENGSEDRPDRQTGRTTVIDMKQDDNRELTDAELDAVSGAWGNYVYTPAKPIFMSPDNQKAIAISHELSALYLANQSH
jgi:hypothetical protein